MKLAKGHVAQRCSAGLGLAAVATAIGLTMLATPDGNPTAHQKFTVVTVIAKPAATAAATVTETDKPHELQITRATPEIRARRTISTQP
jgi:hypothetical protein